MSGSHEKLPKLFWIQIALVVIVGVMFLLAPSAKKETSVETKEVSKEVQSAAANLKPVGKTAITDNSTSGATQSRSGEKVYNSVCGTCHNTGIANAPKINDKAAWEPRVTNGLVGLFKTATNGKGAMPPRGGDPAITDEELKATILFMTKKAGVDLTSTTQNKQTGPNNTKAKDAPKTTTSTHKTDGNNATTPATDIASATAAISAAPAAPKAPSAPPPPANSSNANNGSTMSMNLEEGKKVYKSSCFACHDTGVAGAPKLTDKAAWAPRIATGNAALYNSALNGKGVMPAKGGNMGLSDNKVKAAVDYMAATAQ